MESSARDSRRVAPEQWQAAPERLTLAPGEVHIWRVALDGDPALEASLTADEKERAARFHFARDRRRYVAGRGTLRALLGAYLSLPAGEVRLQYGAQGKPALAAEHGSTLQFNVAHSHELALLAFTRGRALGVDVEYARPLPEMLSIASRFFSAQEVAALRATPEAAQRKSFFRIWSRKEAFIKATGKGLSQPLEAFNVMAADGRPLTTVELEGEKSCWRLWDLAAGEAYGAALVVWVDAGCVTLRQFDYQGP